MKYATTSTLESLTPILDALRELPALQEWRPGIFYLRSSALLHFHEDAADLFADAEFHACDFEPLPVNTLDEQAALLLRVKSTVLALPLPKTEK